MISVTDLRKIFIDFFAQNGHTVVPSAALVPQNDPTLMFVNAGMVPFKNYFTGAETPSFPRAVSTQKCVRAGGKHNDLENVGYTDRHLTFFEMLGNFSFGDYFKEDAIKHAWNLITQELALPKDKLLVTVYHDDDEAFDFWKKIADLPDEKIIRISTDDNFWSMGDTGPCGPCSEIFYDHGPEVAGGPPGSPDEDGDRFVEIWNLVFMQYEQRADGTRVDLPKPSIDTGMGLERVAAVLQGKHSIFETDLFQALIQASVDITGQEAKGDALQSHRVIADHLRSTSFLVADGVLPSNEGRGYVVRRIMRRAMRHAHILGCTDPLMHRLVPTLIAQMGDAFPELKRAESLIVETLKTEEERFKQMLGRGLKLLDEEVETLSEGQLSGDAAFKLYDTYGFPVDLTQDILRGRGITVDMDGFDAAMAEQKKRARAAWSGSGDEKEAQVWLDLADTLPATDFLGYTQTEAEAQILAIVQDGKSIEKADKGAEVWVVANQTPFYAESGGQVGDTGLLAIMPVLNTQKRGGGDLFAHQVSVGKSGLAVGQDITLKVDGERRQNICQHHSVTHLLHAALHDVLGNHVTQKGSLQNDTGTRFDVSHTKAITPEELRQVEDQVNQQIRLNTPVTTSIMTPDEAVEQGAMALFGEKYGDEVRVVKMGADNFSLELCGGTHVARTGEMGLFKILNESAVAAGVRRIEAVAGNAAEQYVQGLEDLLAQAKDILKTSSKELPGRLQTLLEERKKQEEEISTLRKKLATSGASGQAGGPDVMDIGGIKFARIDLKDVPAKELKPMVDEFKQKLESGVVSIVAESDGRVSVVVGVTADLTARINAVDLVRVASSQLGGKGGGGRPDMAQAGGTDASKAKNAFEAIASELEQLAS